MNDGTRGPVCVGLGLGRVPAPAASVVRSTYVPAMAEGRGGEDIVALTEMYRKWGERGDG